MSSTTSSSSNTIYYSWVEGSVRKTRSVIVVDKKDAMAEFLQTFVLPLIASISFLALIIILAKHFGDKLGKVKGAMKFIGNPLDLGAITEKATEAAGEMSEMASKGAEKAGKIAEGDFSVDIEGSLSGDGDGGEDSDSGDEGGEEDDEEEGEEEEEEDSEKEKLEEEKSKLETLIARLEKKLDKLLGQGPAKAKKKKRAKVRGDDSDSDSDSDSGSESGGGGPQEKLKEKKIKDLRVQIDEKRAKLAKVSKKLDKISASSKSKKNKKSKKSKAKKEGKKGVAPVPVPEAGAGAEAGTGAEVSPSGAARDPYVWKFTAWQVIWFRLIPPLLTWVTFCTVTAAGAGKVSALTSSYVDSLSLVSCLVAQNSTTSKLIATSKNTYSGGWWENPYGACARGADATQLYASDTAPEGKQLCAWPKLVFLSDSLKSSVTYGTWAYSTPIITCILTIFVLSGAFILHDANKKSPTGGTVARRWTDTQTTIRWKKKEQLKTLQGSKGKPSCWPFESIETIDMYAVERTDMDRTMILYLPVELQNHIRKTEKLILDHFSDFAIKDESSANKTKDPPAEMVERVKARAYYAMEKMYAELDEASAFYEENQPPPPVEPVPIPGQEEQNKRAAAAYRALLRKYNIQKQSIAKALETFVQLKDDLGKVEEALRDRKAALEVAKKGEAARVDQKLCAGLEVIVNEFSEFLVQIVEPDRKKGRNLFLSFGPQTLLRGGIPGSPTEIPTQSLSLLLATITFANNYFCDSLVTDITTVYSPDTPFQPGCPNGLVSWAQSSLPALAEFKKTSGLAAIAVFLGLVNSVVTITTLMGKQTGELIKRIKTRGQDLIKAAESNEPPPISCVDTCLPSRAAARRSLAASFAQDDALGVFSDAVDEIPKPAKAKSKKKKGTGGKAKQPQQQQGDSEGDSDSDGDSINNFDSDSDSDSDSEGNSRRRKVGAAATSSSNTNTNTSSNTASALTIPMPSLDLFNAPANTVSFVSSLVCGMVQPPKEQIKWYYVSASNERKGPVTLDDLYTLLVDEEIGPRTSVWRKGMDNWLPLEACPVYKGLVGRKTWAEASSFDLEQPPPPVPPSPSPSPAPSPAPSPSATKAKPSTSTKASSPRLAKAKPV